MTIVMGLDQHRAQVSAEWLDTVTGEVCRARVAPADREAVRRFLGRFAGDELEVALEATTGWRFVVEELRGMGAVVHLAEPAQASALRGNKRRPKSDWSDARHLRELLVIGRLPESWIPPDHLLDLRSKVRLRHTLVDQRGEWQQRIRAVLYHHGLPHRAELHLLRREGLAWLEQVDVPDAAREQITVALAMSEALDAQIAPLDRQLRAYARRQSGCRALMRHYGIGELTSVAILAELGDCQRFSSSRQAVRYSGLDVTVYQSDQRRSPGQLSRQRPCCAGRSMRQHKPHADPAVQTATTTTKPRSDSALTELVSRSRASSYCAHSTPCARSARTRSSPHDANVARQRPHSTLIRRGPLPPCRCRHPPGDGPKRLSGRNSYPQRAPHPITIMSPTTQSRTKISLGARAHEHPDPTTRNHSPPTNDYPRLTDETQHR